MHFIYLLFIIYLVGFALCSNDEQHDYCVHPDCSLPNQHTMCVARHKKSPQLYASGMTTWMRYQILLLHNKHRDNIAMGLEAGQPPATNMRKMYWDYELEQMADVWARQCRNRHDECRNTIRFNVVQNMDVRPVLPKVTEAQLLADSVGAWFSGSRVLPLEHVLSFTRSNCSAPGGCNAHWYSAAAWASTWRLGCSQSLCTARRRSCVLFSKRNRQTTESTRETDGRPSSENILRRTRYMTVDTSTNIADFEYSRQRTKESPLYRGRLGNFSNSRPAPNIVVYTFCNYGPAGNIEGFPIYEPGSTCSNCPQGTQCGDRMHRGICSVNGDPDSM